MMLVLRSTISSCSGPMPIIAQMIFSGSRAETCWTKSHGPVSSSSSTICAAVTLHVLLEPLDHLRGERPGHDPAQPGVPRVVHADHRAEVLVVLGGQVDDARRAAGRGEQLGMPAGLGHVRVPDERVVPAALGRRERDLRLGEPGRPGSARSLANAACRCVGRPRPELVRGQVDVQQVRVELAGTGVPAVVTERRSFPAAAAESGSRDQSRPDAAIAGRRTRL